MAPTHARPEALAAPGLIGPVSIIKQPTDGPRSNRRARSRPFSHVHLEVDLLSGGESDAEPSRLERWRQLLSQKDVVESSDLVLLTVGTLHALSACRFRRVDHWEIVPGGWLPPPTTHEPGRGVGEPVGLLLAALQTESGSSVSRARSFSVRLSDRGGNHVDVIIRHIHRERRHALSLDLWGLWTKATVGDLKGALSERLPVRETTQTKHQYA
ncbi:MAG: hypothetical protein L3K03_08270 [Thermoplasmata archaeon]|nr:hypothetical protein [Thermoplasmata archaeon]